ncbi:MAG: TlpA family protein disulfide reductase [Proteobacteria bacterium]|nr:TlpA family protein disulfide reductase [Pseudomonadota bacterium]MCP4921939.1 TlpA family protein disulfide reductase [Pseudomonadota bacterium]
MFTLAALLATADAADKAPDFTLRDLSKEEVTLSELEGNVVLVNFWATWCVPCMVEMPYIEELYTTHKDDGFVVLAISADDARSSSKVKPTVKSKGWTFPVLLDTQTKVVAQYNPQKTLPYTVLIDEKGDIIWQHQGYTAGDEEEMIHKVTDALAAKKAREGEAAAPE